MLAMGGFVVNPMLLPAGRRSPTALDSLRTIAVLHRSATSLTGDGAMGTLASLGPTSREAQTLCSVSLE
jgi:hypothetical protein